MAGRILHDEYACVGRSIQFHPNTTYENFIGGPAPVAGDGSLGFRFAPAPGFLMESAAAALNNPSKKYLLHIDEINRADLSKILGEAIYLLALQPGFERKIDLPYDFGEPFRRTFFLPPNLHILGTMNSADRSIAVVDVAVRRRFAFVSLWPSMPVVEERRCQLTQKAFRDLLSIFIEHASEDALSLVPGHSYFLAEDEAAATINLRTSLAPLADGIFGARLRNRLCREHSMLPSMARQSVTSRSSSRGRYHHPRSGRSPLVGRKLSKDVCFELEDHSSIEKSAIQFFGIKGALDSQSQAARLAHRFITQNRPLLELLDVSVTPVPGNAAGAGGLRTQVDWAR